MSNTNLDLGLLLRGQLNELAHKNPRYSLRAFAKRIGLSPSYLSRILNGKKQLSRQRTQALIGKIDLPHSTIQALLKNSTLPKKKATELGIEQRVLQYQSFRILADWYHFPLLELIMTPTFCSDPTWIASKLGISKKTARDALSRLESAKLIVHRDGQWLVLKNEFIRTTDDIRDLAISRHHKQMLEKASESLDEQKVEEREFQALNLCFDPSQMPAAKKAIRKFFRDFNKQFASNCASEIYQLNTQFFALTKENS